MPTLDERINNRKNKKKRTITFKTLSIIFMINIAIGCIFAIKKYLMTDSERKTTMHRVYNWIKDKSLDNHKNDAVS